MNRARSSIAWSDKVCEMSSNKLGSIRPGTSSTPLVCCESRGAHPTEVGLLNSGSVDELLFQPVQPGQQLVGPLNRRYSRDSCGGASIGLSRPRFGAVAKHVDKFELVPVRRHLTILPSEPRFPLFSSL
jgi:hypothetical protein